MTSVILLITSNSIIKYEFRYSMNCTLNKLLIEPKSSLTVVLF